jgi:hypothetical protein
MLHWLRKLLPFFAFLGIYKKYQKRSALIKIEAAKAYVLGVKKTRHLLLGTLCALFSMVLFFAGLLLIYTALFVYSGWSIQTKFLVALLSGGIGILSAGAIIFFLFREKTWVKFSGIKHLLKTVVEKKPAA